MPRIIIESKMLENNKNGVLKLRINNERVEELKNVKNEIDLDYGEQTLQVYNNFFTKTPKKVINVESVDQKYKITLHYKAWGITAFLHLVMMVLIAIFKSNPLFTVFPIVTIEFLFLIFIGAFEIREVKRKDS